MFLEDAKGLALHNFAGLDAARADAHTLAAAVHLSLDGLKIHVPASAGGVVGVGDIIAKLRAFAAKIAFLCHDEVLQFRIAETSLEPGGSSLSSAQTWIVNDGAGS